MSVYGSRSDKKAWHGTSGTGAYIERRAEDSNVERLVVREADMVWEMRKGDNSTEAEVDCWSVLGLCSAFIRSGYQVRCSEGKARTPEVLVFVLVSKDWEDDGQGEKELHDRGGAEEEGPAE